ncbi:hypothetical protein Ocin01_03132 [Orchesella cincta]|uniref:Uncharacterized protein n=1 Tax=Orchesella cincta TaxID=48709 RepID=A0A1D2NEL5_ORCCI|nr:hypothetical protein Ocin01_03132 [Orchesella cincta]
MKAVVALLALVAAANAGLISAPATVIARAPALDSAVIKSDRLGGNFAYSVSEAHAYTATQPIIQHVAQPVAVSYSAPQVVQQVVAAPAVRTVAVAQPVAYAHQQVVAQQLVAAPAYRTVSIAQPTILAGNVPAATVRIA